MPYPDNFVPCPDSFMPCPDKLMQYPDIFMPYSHSFMLCPDSFMPFLKILIPLILYLSSVFVVRASWLAKLSGQHLVAQISGVRARLKIEQIELEKLSSRQQQIIQEINYLLSQAEISAKVCPWSPCFGGEAVRQKGWRLVHEAQILSTDLCSPEIVLSHLQRCVGDLEAINRPSAKAFAMVIRQELKKESSPHVENIQAAHMELTSNKENIHIDNVSVTETSGELPYRKALLKEALSMIYEARDDDFEKLAGWAAKAYWLLIIVSLLILCIGTEFKDSPNFLLLGAVGGMLAKLRGVIKRPHQPFDYGVSWSTLYLTPLVGALTSWSGIFLFSFLVQSKFFGNSFEFLGLQNASNIPQDNYALFALALAFGYSATFFEKLMSHLEEKALGEEKETAAKTNVSKS